MKKIVLPSLFDRRDGLTDVIVEYVTLFGRNIALFEIAY
jgi:hypothetical protein